MTRRVASAALVANGLLHLVLAGGYLERSPLLAVLFVIGAVALAVAAWFLWDSAHQLGWALGLTVCTVMAASFVMSRTIGFLGFHQPEWTAGGIVALMLEATFAVTYGLRRLALHPPARQALQR